MALEQQVAVSCGGNASLGVWLPPDEIPRAAPPAIRAAATAPLSCQHASRPPILPTPGPPHQDRLTLPCPILPSSLPAAVASALPCDWLTYCIFCVGFCPSPPISVGSVKAGPVPPSQMCPKHPEQSLAYTRCSVNACRSVLNDPLTALPHPCPALAEPQGRGANRE